jgi:hypothetical protein
MLIRGVINIKNKMVSLILCVLLITISTVSAINIDNKEKESSKLLLIRIDIDDNINALPRDMEIVVIKNNEYVELIVTESELQKLLNLGVGYEIIIPDLKKHDQTVRGSYHTLAQVESIIQSIANNYPDITDLYSIGTTYEGRDIWCLEISDNPGVDEGEPGIVFSGLHHAREWPTVEICLYAADQLTSEYGSNTEITNAVNNNRIWLITCVNPDGYYYCYDQGHDWRKNRRPVPGGIGIDLNRNYGGSSDGNPWGSWGSVGEGSITNNPGGEVYCGPSPFSEAETQAMRDIYLNNNIHASIAWHTHGELVLYSWAYSYDQAPDYNYLSQVAQNLASEITKQSGYGTYTPQQGAVLYPTTGDNTDWVYGYGHYVQGRPTFAFTIEACSSFHPSASYLDQIVQENFDAALYLLGEAENIRNTVTPRVIPPIIDEMENDEDGDYTISWEEQNPDANPTKFQLDELIGPNFDLDDAESGTGYWDIDGFSLSTIRSHTSSHSYKSGTGNNKVYSMTTVDPIPVSEGMELDFWCWYDIEEDWDMAFVEVSTNGRSYDFIDSYTGSSGGWLQKQYSLDDYAGESVYIRFRYITDDLYEKEGIYLDDITPVVGWDYITTLSDTITNDFFNITGKQNGTYYYRVKGYNSEHNWGDFCSLEDIEVGITENDPPNNPIIDGPTIGKPGELYDYTFSAVDPNGDNVTFYIQWGDGDIEEWIGPYYSGEEFTLSHSWDTKDTFVIKVKARDDKNDESGWVLFEVTMPRNHDIFHNLFETLPILYRIIQFIFG